MSEPFLGEIRIFTFNFAPKGWAFCNGQLLPINQNQALFSILGTTYGGNGLNNFALPNLQGRTAIHPSGAHPLGSAGGEDTHTLVITELPSHNHIPVGSSVTADQTSPANGFWANPNVSAFSTNAPNAAMAGQAMGAAGGSQPHNNLQPCLVVNFCVALNGIFPSRN